MSRHKQMTKQDATELQQLREEKAQREFNEIKMTAYRDGISVSSEVSIGALIGGVGGLSLGGLMPGLVGAGVGAFFGYLAAMHAKGK